MVIQLVDRNIGMCDSWNEYFAPFTKAENSPSVIVHQGDFFDLETDCIISPANSFGFMDGGLDLVISQKLGWLTQERVKNEIKIRPINELLVGEAIIVETDYDEIPYCISAPTMREPILLGSNSLNSYLAAKAIFALLKDNLYGLKKVTISGLGTGVGAVPYNICAFQMYQAYYEIFIKHIYPERWQDIKYFKK